VSLETDVKQPADEYVMINEKSTADSGSGPENDARQRGADESYEDQKNLRADSPATSDHILAKVW
jgi:hypothetical protein